MPRPSDFTPVKTLEENQAELLKALAEGYTVFAEALMEALPAGEHRDTAMSKLLASKFFASQAVTHAPVPPSFYLSGKWDYV